jgi:hypothetical protein
MLSWRGPVDGKVGTVERLILLLLDDVRLTQGASPESAFDQQLM